MTSFPGPHPIHGDTVEIIGSTTSLTITGSITSQGVLRDGCGLVELTLPDADPQQRCDMERSTWIQYKLYRGGALVYSSGHLELRETRRDDNGALVLSASP
ncbi:hypothetical protein GCM10009577_85700 [Streptomyces javensis]